LNKPVSWSLTLWEWTALAVSQPGYWQFFYAIAPRKSMYRRQIYILFADLSPTWCLWLRVLFMGSSIQLRLLSLALQTH